jgi:hypothetical protein
VDEAPTQPDTDPLPNNNSAAHTAVDRIRAEVGDRDIGPAIRAEATTPEAKDAIRAHLGLSGLDPVDAQRYTGPVSGWIVTHPQPYREPRRLFYPDEPGPAHAPELEAAATPSQPRIRVEHTETGTLVVGTERGDTEAHAALKQHGFKWSRNLGAWYLPRNYHYQTRSLRVQALKRNLGDRVQIEHGEPTSDLPPDPSLAPEDNHSPAEQPRRPVEAPDETCPEQTGEDLDETQLSDRDPRDESPAELERLTRLRFHPTGGSYGVWDMRDGRFLAIKEGPGGLPQGSPVGPAHLTRTQVDAYVAALNAGASPDQAQHAAYRADPTGYRRGNQPVTNPVVDNPPPGAWSDADRVDTTRGPDTSSWPSVQRHPLGTRLSVHAAGADGPGRRLGHGTVTGHIGPYNVLVESPWGTKRVAHIDNVSPYDGALDPPSTTPASSPAPDDPWRALAAELPGGQPLLDDPAWPHLASALHRAAAVDGYDLTTRLPALAAQLPLDERRPASDLLYRLADDCPALHTPLPTQGYTPATAARPPQPPPLPRLGPSTHPPINPAP